MKAALKINFAVAFALTLAVFVHGQSQNNLQGRVITPDGSQPSAPVRVSLTFNGRHLYETFTDLSGRFSFPGLARGTYQLTAEGDGKTFETTTVYAEVAAFGAPQLFTQDIQLRAIRMKGVARSGVVNAFSQDVPKAAQKAFERAEKLTNDGKADEAEVKLFEAINIFPAFFEAHLALGNHFLKSGAFDKAIAELDKAREVNPNDERLYQSFGLILMKQRNYPVAVAIFAEASRLNPRNPLNVVMRATALIHQASLTDPSSPDLKTLLDQADVALAKAYELGGKDLKVDSLTLALFYELKGEPDRSASELEEYLRKTPSANAAAIQGEIKRLRVKASEKNSP
jgi:tetratricopeptide (TPR) repeat protein